MGRKQENRVLVVVHHRQSYNHPSIDSRRRTFEALLSEEDDRFFPSHYLTKFAVVAAAHSSSGSQSVSQFVVEEYRAVELLKTRKKLPPRRINWGRCCASFSLPQQLMAVPIAV